MPDTVTDRLEIVLVCGLAGAGKTTASDALEDHGFFCVDNLPVALVAPLVEFSLASGGKIHRLGLVVTVESAGQALDLVATRQRLIDQGHRVELLFLDAGRKVLVRRFSETRRRHPLDHGGGQLDTAIQAERQILAALREAASQVVDSSDLKGASLRDEVVRRFTGERGEALQLGLFSFGFKYGVPRDASLVFDARFLPNPYFVEELREKTGRDAAVADYVLHHDEARTLLDHLEGLVESMVPLYRQASTAYVGIAIGCTGGRHRSVALTEALHARLQAHGLPVAAPQHRDILK